MPAATSKWKRSEQKKWRDLKWETLTASIIVTQNIWARDSSLVTYHRTYLLSLRKNKVVDRYYADFFDGDGFIDGITNSGMYVNVTLTVIVSVEFSLHFCFLLKFERGFVWFSSGLLFFGKQKSFRIQRMFSFQSFLTRSLFNEFSSLVNFWILLRSSHIFEVDITCWMVHSMVNLVTGFVSMISILFQQFLAGISM